MQWERDMVKEAADKFPSEFGLRAFPGDKFRIGLSQSYCTGGAMSPGKFAIVMLYTQRYDSETNTWGDWCKGTVEELRRNIVSL